jgi:hypothetical protein
MFEQGSVRGGVWLECLNDVVFEEVFGWNV